MAASFTDLYNYSAATGMVVPQTGGIKQSVRNAMIDVFGSSIDLSDDTANGRFVDMLTRMFKSVVEVNAKNVNYLNLAYATGLNLDNLASFFRVKRIGATRTKLAVTMYSSKQYAKLANGSILEDYLGNQYVLNCNPVFVNGGTSSNQLFYGAVCDYELSGSSIPDENGTFKYMSATCAAICTEPGPQYPVLTNYNYTNGFRDQSLLKIVSAEDGSVDPDAIGIVSWNVNAGCYAGSFSESDMLLRSRLSNCRDFGSSSCQAIANAIWREFPDIRHVRISDSKYSQLIQIVISGIDTMSDADGNILSIQDQYDIRKKIARIIYDTMPSGIKVVASEHPTVANPSVYSDTGTGLWPRMIRYGSLMSRFAMNVQDRSSGMQYTIIIDEPVSIGLYFNINYTTNGYNGDDVEKDIRDILCSYVSSKTTALTADECTTAIVSSIPGVFITKLDFGTFSNPSSNRYPESGNLYQTEIMNVTQINFNPIIAPPQT